MNADTRLEHLTPYFQNGLSLVLLKNKDKAPYLKGWREMTITESQAKKHVLEGGNIGFKIGRTDLVIDVDPRNFAPGDNPLARLTKDFNLHETLSNAPTVITGSGGTHYYLTLPENSHILLHLKDVHNHDLYEGVEFKSFGQQVVVPGSIHPNGTAYLPDPLSNPLDQRPAVPDLLLQRLMKAKPTSTPSVQTTRTVITPEELESLLIKIDPTDYRHHEDWLRLMMSCHAATDSLGKHEFVEWSISDPKYTNHKTIIMKRWDSLKNSVPQGITIATLYKALIDAGHKIPNHLEFQHIPDTDEILSPMDRIIEELNQEWCMVFGQGEPILYREVYSHGLKSRKWVRYTLKGFQLFYANKMVEIETKLCNKASEWLGHKNRREVTEVVFDPTRYNIPGKMNLWTGFSYEPMKGDWSYLQELIRVAICQNNVEYEAYLLNWIAYLLQYPGEPAEVAMVLRGSKGIGKGTLGKAIMRILNAHALQVSTPEHITGRFNSHLRELAFLFVDEAFWAGSHAGEGQLKRMITEPTMFYEAKGVDGVQGKNCLSILIASNANWVVPAGTDGERRFCMFDMDDTYRGNEPFWIALNEQIDKQGGLSAFMYDMQHRDITGWYPRSNVPQTKALSDQKKETMDDMSKWWLSVLINGEMDLFLSKAHWAGHNPSKRVIGVKNLYHVYRSGMVELNSRGKNKPDNVFIRDLKKLGALERRVMKYGKWSYQVNPLDVCRHNFDEFIGAAQNWPTDDDEL